MKYSTALVGDEIYRCGKALGRESLSSSGVDRPRKARRDRSDHGCRPVWRNRAARRVKKPLFLFSPLSSFSPFPFTCGRGSTCAGAALDPIESGKMTERQETDRRTVAWRDEKSLSPLSPFFFPSVSTPCRPSSNAERVMREGMAPADKHGAPPPPFFFPSFPLPFPLCVRRESLRLAGRQGRSVERRNEAGPERRASSPLFPPFFSPPPFLELERRWPANQLAER